MATATIVRTGQIVGFSEGGSLTLSPANLSLTSPVLSRIDPLNLSSGDNTVAVPVGATIMWFTPPSANTQALRLKGNAGDTGIGISKTLSWPIFLDGSGDDVIINAAGTVNGCTVQFA